MKHLIEIQMGVIERSIAKVRQALRDIPAQPRERVGARVAEARRLAAELLAADDDDEDVWTDLVLRWTDAPLARWLVEGGLRSTGRAAGRQQRVYLVEILEHGIGFTKGEADHSHKIRVSGILRRDGWMKRRESQKTDKGKRLEYWVPPYPERSK